MSALTLCILVIATGQSWGTPVMQEAELAAPVEIERPPAQPPAGPDRGAVQAESWDMDTRPLPPARETAPEPARELRWEYDDDGRPVARPSAPEAEAPRTVTPPPAPAPAPAPAPTPAPRQERQERPRSDMPIATFWFVLPK